MFFFPHSRTPPRDIADIADLLDPQSSQTLVTAAYLAFFHFQRASLSLLIAATHLAWCSVALTFLWALTLALCYRSLCEGGENTR